MRDEAELLTPEEEAQEYSDIMMLTGSFYNPIHGAKIIELGSKRHWYESSSSPVDPYNCYSVTGFRFSVCSETYSANWEWHEENHSITVLDFTEGTALRLCGQLGIPNEKELKSLLDNVHYLESYVAFTALDYL